MRISYNSPVVLSFSLIALIILIVNSTLIPGLTTWCFRSPTPAELFSLNGLIGSVTHVLGHSGWPHFISNITFILLLGPLLEEKYGSTKLLNLIVVTAIVTSIFNALLFGNHVLGASGIVFMFIILSSITSMGQKRIPLTFILVVFIFLGGEVISGFRIDNISQFSHIIGGLTGAIAGWTTRPKFLR